MVKKILKIAIFHCGFVYSGGGERVVLEEAKGLKKRGFEVEVSAPTIDKRFCYPELLEEVKPKMFLPSFFDRLPLRDALRMTTSCFLAPILALGFRDIDIFIGANQPGAWIAFCMAKVLKKPYLVYLNQPTRLVYLREIDKQTGWQTRKDYYFLGAIIKKIKPFIALIDRFSINSADSLLVDGDHIAGWVKKVYGRPVVVAPAGALCQPKDRLLLNPDSSYKGKIKINGLVIKKPYILITNRHEPQKRFEYVIEALKLILKDYPEVRLVISGGFSSYTPTLKKLASRLGLADNIAWTGRLNEKNLQKLYQHCAVYCYPAPEEDFGLGILEAGGWGVPTVAWNYAGPKVTVENGESGFLAKPYEIDDYAAKVLTILKNPKLRSKMGEAAWFRTKNCFSWEKHLDILEEEIRKIIE